MVKVYIPGCWDLLHVGHVVVLEAAKRLGDQLIVGVASDEVIRKDKGRLPIIPESHRVYMVASLECVDTACIYHDLEFITHLDYFKPDTLAVGEQWGKEKRHKDAERWANENGCSIVTLPYTKGVSTTQIIEWVRSQK